MAARFDLATNDILTVFNEEITGLGGRVSEAFQDDRRLFARSILHREDEVRRGDRVQGGVALKATGEGVWLYPYVFRLVCKNGAILAQTIDSRFVDVFQQEPDEAEESIRECVVACAAPHVFENAVHGMRSACAIQVDMALSLMPFLSRFPGGLSNRFLSDIMNRFFSDRDHSQFGLANAITAVARDTRDPDARWKLEEFGGGILVAVDPPPPTNDGHAGRRRRTVEVG
jgi:hypothetical protein